MLLFFITPVTQIVTKKTLILAFPILPDISAITPVTSLFIFSYLVLVLRQLTCRVNDLTL